MPDSNPNRPIIENSLEGLVQGIVETVQNSPKQTRTLVGIAGPPGAGKSTLLAQLVSALQSQFSESRVIGIPMDGFHLDNQVLENADFIDRKGAPHTFDVDGLLAMIKRLASTESPVYAPEFDRVSDLSRNCAIKITSVQDIVLVEGNYLLLKQPVWQEIASYLNLSITIDVSDELIEKRLLQRWLDHGFNSEDALAKAKLNDLPNANTVKVESAMADIIFQPENT